MHMLYRVMNFAELLSTYIAFIGSVFMFMPLMIVKNWYDRKNSEGFSVEPMLMAMFMMSCMARHSLLTGDTPTFYSNIFTLSMALFYLTMFAIYTEHKKSLAVKVSILVTLLTSVLLYASGQEHDDAVATLAKAIAVSSIAMIGGPFFQIKDVLSRGTTEFVPFWFALLQVKMMTLRSLLSILQGNYYLTLGSVPGLILGYFSFSLFYFYPPLTWKVPLIGSGPVEKKKEQ